MALLALLALTLVRLLVAATTPLAADEAYYWVWSRALQPGYLDHPPMVALWIRLGTALAGDTALGVRLLGPLAAAAGSLLLADAADRLFPARRAGVKAAVLLNATLMFGAGSVMMTPDTPLLFFVTVALWSLVRVRGHGAWWLPAGAAAGLAMDSKYTAVLVGAGVVLWLLWVPSFRAQFRTPWLWAGKALAIVLFLPVVVWNAQHAWASFLRQGGRTGAWQPERAPAYLGDLFAGQFALATPLIFVLFAAGLWRALRGAAARDPAWTLLAALSAPGLLLFLQHAIGDRVQANWVALVYPPLAVAGGAASSRWWRPAAGLGFALTAVVYLQASSAPFPLPRRLDPTLIRLAGWDRLAADADALRVQFGAHYLASEEYGLASLLAWWAPPDTQVVGAERRWSLFRLSPAPDGPGLLLITERRQEGPDPTIWEQAERIGSLTRARAGVEAEAFKVYRVVLRNGAPSAELPRRGGER